MVRHKLNHHFIYITACVGDHNCYHFETVVSIGMEKFMLSNHNNHNVHCYVSVQTSLLLQNLLIQNKITCMKQFKRQDSKKPNTFKLFKQETVLPQSAAEFL